MTGNESLNMAKYIFHDILQCSIKTLCWGIDFRNIRVIDGGTEFHVQGFKVTGLVQIQYEEGPDLFKVTIIPDDKLKETIVMEDVYVDQLVDLIDEQVEHCDKYDERISQEYGLTTKVAV